MTIDLSAYDECDFTSIKDHAGWVVKRTRETLTQGGNKIPAKASVADSTILYGNKVEALEIVSALGKDVKQADGKFRFTVHDNVVPFFVYLHNLVEKLINANANAIALQKGNILIDCLDKMATNKELREKWDHLSSQSDATSVIVLQRIVAFFIKSKQQILREKKGLKPHKSSVTIRQQLRLTTSKAISHHPSKNVMVNEEINQLRSGDLTSVTINHFLNSLTIQSQLKQKELLGKLTGKELATILKSVGKPSFLGKKKVEFLVVRLTYKFSQCTGRQCNLQSKPEVNLLCQMHGISSSHLLDNLSEEEE